MIQDPFFLVGSERSGTTLLRLMAGLDQPTTGRVLVDGRDSALQYGPTEGDTRLREELQRRCPVPVSL